MSVPLTTNPGGVFKRLGVLLKLLADINVYQLTTFPTDLTNILAQYENIAGVNSQPAIAAPLSQTADSSRQAAGGFAAQIQTCAQATVNQMVYEDNPQASRSDLKSSLVELIRQMKASSDTVKAATVTATSAAIAGYTNTGNGALVLSTKRGDGLVQENLIAEVGRLTCTSDSQTGGSTASQESFTYKGSVAQTDLFHWEWPLGSGATQTVQTIDPKLSNNGNNLLNNSGFETFTVANTPDNWVIAVGTAGTNVFSEASVVYTGSKALRIAGSATNVALTQTFNVTSGGTAGKLVADTQYAVAIWLKVDVAPAAGVLTVELIDGSNTVINDDQGVANAFTISCPALTTSYAAFSGVFRLPKLVPTTVKIRLRLSTALSAGTNLYLDNLGLGKTTALYAGGPELAIFAGSTNWLLNDRFSVTATNNRGGASNLKSFQVGFDRLFNMRGLGLLLPSTGSPTIADSLIA